MYSDFQNLLECIPDAIFLVDLSGHIKYSNTASETLFGYSSVELSNKSINKLLPQSQRQQHAKLMADYLKDPSARSMGSRINMSAESRNGIKFPVDIMLNKITLNGEDFIICITRDMSVLKRTSNKLELALKKESRLARHDPLTNVANRRLFNEHLNTIFHLSNRIGFIFTLVFVDIDNFKSINDRFGHTIGDEVLIQTAKRLKSCARKSDLISRFGGDEFAVILEHKSVSTIEPIVSKIYDSLKKLYRNSAWPISVSMGAVCCDTHPPSQEALFEITDELLYKVKKSGKNAFKLCYLSKLS